MQVIKGGVVFLLIAIRLTFGGKPCPFEWCSIAEPICDLANDLIECEDWDTYNIQSPAFKEIPSTTVLPDHVPFALARALIVNVPLHRYGKCDEFIDDIVTVGVDHEEETRRRLRGAAPLAVFIVSRANHPNEPITRDDMITGDKMQAEGGLEETKTVLGWFYDTRRLLISLPLHKFKVWSGQISEAITKRTISMPDLDTMVGRLNHAAGIIPLSRHFLSRIRFLLKNKTRWQRIFITDEAIEDLKLWLQLLSIAKDGISMNLLSFRQPDRVHRTDACETGIGGFSSTGRAWRWEIPLALRGRAHIGLLEFLAEIAAVKIDIIEGTLSPDDCVLLMGDSSNAIGWVRKSNFMEPGENFKSADYPAKLAAARHLAFLTISNKIVLYSQWFAGEDNIIPDILSRDWHLTDSQILELLTHLFPTQLHPHFHISPIPTEVEQWLSSILLLLPVQQQRLKQHSPSGFGLGGSGKTSCPPSALKAMTSWSHLLHGTGKSYAPPSPKPSENAPSSQMEEPKKLLLEQSRIPSDMWHRPSGLLTGRTQRSTRMAQPASC